MIHELPIQRDLRAIARMLAEERRRIAPPDMPIRWLQEDCEKRSAEAHQDFVEAQAHFDEVQRSFFAISANEGNETAHVMLREAREDRDDARDFLARCWDFCQHGLPESWESLDSGVYDARVDELNRELADPDDQPGERGQEERQRPSWKTDESRTRVAGSQGVLF